MEIHRPKLIHNWREFAKEVGIIVLGVLIALGAEQTVQAIERHHKVEAANDAMRLELSRDDGPQIWARYLIHKCVDEGLDAIRGGIESGASRSQVVKLIDGHKTPFWTWDSLAFTAANSSEVALHMPSETLFRWTMAYATMPALNQANTKEFADGAELAALSKTGGALSEAERSQVLRAVELLRRDNAAIFASVRVALPAIYKAGVRLDPHLLDQLKAQLAPANGACLDTPPER